MAGSKQFTLHVTIQVAPQDIDAFLKALQPCWAGCVAESECLFFDIFQDIDTPGLFRFVEVWSEDKEWFLTKQLTKPYYHPYVEITQPMWIKDRIMVYTTRQPGWSVCKEGYLTSGTKA